MIVAWLMALVLAAANPPAVPFVGCPSGGQQGLQPAPLSGPVPPVASPALAARLAFYSDGHGGVLAPRGWHCVSVSGSSGGAMIVSPDRIEVVDVMRGDRRLPGAGLQVTYSFGGTSGRFAVAETIARLFPEHMAFAREVVALAAADDIEVPLPDGPYPNDRIRRLSPTEVLFRTPAGRTGLGTEGSMFAGETPIAGIVILFPEIDMNVLQLSYRLAPDDSDLAPAIVGNVRRWRGGAHAPER